jgi:hypothetical protein
MLQNRRGRRAGAVLFHLIVGFGALLALCAACTSTVGTPVADKSPGDTSGGASVPGISGFLHADSASVVFLQWPVDGTGFVSGTAKEDYVTGDSGRQLVNDNTGNFTGQVNRGGGVAFSFAGSWGAVYGTETGDTLTLNLPQRGGGLQETVFRAATPDDYNSALAALQNSTGQSNQQAQQQQQQALQVQAQLDAEQTLGRDLARLGPDESAVSAALAVIPGAEKGVAGKSATADGKLAAEKAYAGPAADCYQLSSMEYDANSAVYDLNSAVYDLTGTISDLDSATSTLSDDISQAQKGEQSVQATGGSIPANTDNTVKVASNAVTNATASQKQAQAYGDNATKHGQDVSGTAGSLTANCNTGG